MAKQWTCECHGRPFIHERLTLPFGQEDWQWSEKAGQHVIATYRDKPGANSVYTPSIKRLRRAWLAERVLARHRKAPIADYRKPWEYEYDVGPDLEVRSSEHPSRAVDEFQFLSLLLYPKDRKKVRVRRWLFASVCEPEGHVHFHGWRDGKSIPLSKGEKVYIGKFPATIIARLFPDEMAPMEGLR